MATASQTPSVRSPSVLTPCRLIHVSKRTRSGSEHRRELYEHWLPLPRACRRLSGRASLGLRKRRHDAFQDRPLLAAGILLRRVRRRPQRPTDADRLLDHPERVSGPSRPAPCRHSQSANASLTGNHARTFARRT